MFGTSMQNQGPVGRREPDSIIGDVMRRWRELTGDDGVEVDEPDTSVPTAAPEDVPPAAVPEALPFAFDALGADAERPDSVVPASLVGSPIAARAYASTSAIRSQIESATAQIESTYRRSSEVLMQRQVLSSIESAARVAGKKGSSRIDLTTLQIVDATGTSRSAAEVLERAGLLERFLNADGEPSATIDALTSANDELKSRSDDINQTTQLTMIQMQELMHQKNLLIQLATSELSSREQLERRIAENIR